MLKKCEKKCLKRGAEVGRFESYENMEIGSATMVNVCGSNCIFGNLYLQPPSQISELGARNFDLKVNYRVAMSPTSTLKHLQLDSGD